VIRQAGNIRLDVIVGTAAASGGGTLISFFADTLPIIQWFAATVALISGVVAIILGIRKLIRS
jgi:hypothetical protein